jgi:predicted ATP-dependent endonuclease of OLD family
MAISKVTINDFLVFKGKFECDFCPGINVLIGGNGTGKTTLMKEMYDYQRKKQTIELEGTGLSKRKIFFPEKDILEHAKGLITFIQQKQTGFSQVYKDILIAAQDIPTQEQTEVQKSIGQSVLSVIGGEVKWDKGDGSYYTIRTTGDRIPFSNEASGFKKFGLLGLLVACGQLEKDSILFWDEPENSLNPILISTLADIIIKLARNGVQVFIATHSEMLASYFAVLTQGGDQIMFYSLYKEGEEVKYDSNDRFDLLNPNNLTAEPIKLYEQQLDKGLGE